MNGKVRQVDGRLPRPARLIFGRNELRRPCDRIEGTIVLAVSAAFLTRISMQRIAPPLAVRWPRVYRI
jgi:hypothetical protein